MTAAPHFNTHARNDDRSTMCRVLLDAAAQADAAAVLQALRAGADPNVIDENGRAVVGCAIAGDRYHFDVK